MMERTKSENQLADSGKESFQSQRVFREFHGNINATADNIYPLLCSVREADWLPGSNHSLIYSESGYAENDYIFQSEFFGFGFETWVRYEHKPNESLAYIRTSENLVIKFEIRLKSNADNTTNIRIKLTFTSLKNEGNNMLHALPEELPFNKIIAALEYYIINGKQIG